MSGLLFDSTGTKLLFDASGNLVFDDGNHNYCCCRRCVWTWTATYNCATSAWVKSGPTKSCLTNAQVAALTFDAWVQNPSNGCSWTYRKLGANSCNSTAQCLADPETPADPGGGAPPANPSSACGQCEYCAVCSSYAGLYLTLDGLSRCSPCTYYNRYFDFDATVLNGATLWVPKFSGCNYRLREQGYFSPAEFTSYYDSACTDIYTAGGQLYIDVTIYATYARIVVQATAPYVAVFAGDADMSGEAVPRCRDDATASNVFTACTQLQTAYTAYQSMAHSGTATLTFPQP